jgi:hypothetical protein
MDDLVFEKNYWGDCCNTFDEDQKHYVYAELMGLKRIGYSFDAENKSILDIGGGPTSMLLKTINLKSGMVYDPIDYPQWTKDRYHSKNIQVVVDYGESVSEIGWDEVWLYNCLQHVKNPFVVIKNAMLAAPILRIFEWVDIPPHDGHPHMLTKDLLDFWIGSPGNVCQLSTNGCYGKAYYGCFS